MMSIAVSHLFPRHNVKYSPLDRFADILRNHDPESAAFLVDAFTKFYGSDLANL